MDKKITKQQLQKRIDGAQLIVEKGANYKAVYFADRGIGIYSCKDYVITSTNFHQNVWNRVTGSGYNKPCYFLDQLIDIANAHKDDMADKNGKGEVFYSLEKLKSVESLTEADKLIITMVERWIYVLNDAPYVIGAEKLDVTNLMLQYISWLAKSNTMIQQRPEDVIRNDFNNQYISLFRFLSLDAEIAPEFQADLQAEVQKIESEAYDKIKAYIENKGGKMLDVIALPKSEIDEAQALNELQQ